MRSGCEDEFEARYEPATVLCGRGHIPFKATIDVDSILVEFPRLGSQQNLIEPTAKAIRQMLDIS